MEKLLNHCFMVWFKCGLGGLMYYTKLDVSYGPMVACLSEEAALIGLWFEGQKHFPQISKKALWLRENSVMSDSIKEMIEKLKIQLQAYEDGNLENFDLNLSPEGTDFQKLVWSLLLEIPYGSTSTYGELGKIVAKQLGLDSMSAQAIGGAVGRNPISIIIPCHRVIARDGKLTGYAGGLDKKKALLKHEGVDFEEQLIFNF